MYTNKAHTYDLLYNKWKRYDKEAQVIEAIIGKHLSGTRLSLLEAACGTGNYLQKFSATKYDRFGFDLHDGMVQIAQEKLPQCTIWQADMMLFEQANTQYDVILCLFGSIGYLQNCDNLTKAFVQFAKHVKPNGIVLVEPFLHPKLFKPNGLYMDTYDGEAIKICRMGTSALGANVHECKLSFAFQLGTKEQNVVHLDSWQEEHVMGLFDEEQVMACAKQAGFAHVSYLPEDELKAMEPESRIRGLYVMRK